MLSRRPFRSVVVAPERLSFFAGALLGAALLATCCIVPTRPARAQQEQRAQEQKKQYAPHGERTGQNWQQHVAYDMDVTLKADRHRMRGTQRLRYTNNSPDTLRRVFYHLYFNAFRSSSMMAERNRHLPDPDGRIVPRIFNLGPGEIGYHHIQSLRQDGRPLTDYDVDGTVMEVKLAEPLRPGETTTLAMRFRSQVPLQTRRSGRDNREGIDYSMTQWYPKMAAYDAQGWHADPYVGREFYAPYGTFDVEITLPAKYTLGATGRLQNAGAVGHGYGETGNGLWRPDEASYAPSDSLTWHYEAQNVHDFAWAADPDYRHRRIAGPPPPQADPDDRSADGITYHLLYQPGVAERWKPMTDWVPSIINFYSDQYGPYPYGQFTVAQAGDGGMEYPMMVLITGRRSPRSLLGVTAHESAHEWFYATLGSDETYYAWMDEGFTSYAAAESVAHLAGRPADHTGAYLSVLRAHDVGLFERLNTPADFFQTNYGYGTASYPGGEMLVDMLGYVIGEEQRDEFLDEYYRRFKFRHPQPDDLEKIAEDVSGLQLDWYFEEFTQTGREHDYALDDLKAVRSGNGQWTAEVTLERNDPVVMPADVRITLEDGSTRWATVPLTIMEGHKPVPPGWTVAQAWPWTFEKHTIRVPVPGRPVAAEVDPLGRTPDENRLNNSTRLPVEARFLEAPGQSWKNYRVGYRPLLQYASDFGPGAGMQARGQYLFGKHRVRAMLKLWPQPLATGGEEPQFLPEGKPVYYRPGPLRSQAFAPAVDRDDPDVSFFDGIDYEVSYQTEVEALGAEAEVGARAEKHLGLLQNTLFFERPLGAYGSSAEQRLRFSLVHQLNPSDRAFGRFDDRFEQSIRCPPDVICVIRPPSFAATRSTNPFQREHMLSARLDYDVRSGSGDRVAAGLEVGTSLWDGVQPNATRFWLDARKTADLGPFVGRADVNFGFGDKSLALYKQFRLGAASFEGRWQSDAFRTAAAAFAHPLRDAHLAAFSGAGPVAYLHADDEERDRIGGTLHGTSLLAGSLALQTGPLSENEYVRPFRLEAFSGIGDVGKQEAFLAGLRADELLADAGLGARYDLGALPFLSDYTAQSDVLSGLDVVAKFPFWASDPGQIEAGSDDEWAFRWRLGLTVTP